MNKLETNIKMPTSILIGDDYYIDNRADLLYIKNFRGKKDWVGYLSLEDEDEECVFKAIFAPNEDLLNIYKKGYINSNQKIKEKNIGVDTAKYILHINDRYETIKTGSDGCMGGVLEIYEDKKLKGLMIDMSMGLYMDLDDAKDILNYIFDCKLS